MIIVVYSLLLINGLAFLLHLSVLPQKWLVVLMGILLAIFSYGFYPIAIQQDSQTIALYLHSATVIQGLSILCVAEGMCLLLISVRQLSGYFGEPLKRWHRYSLYVIPPSVLLTISLAEVNLFFQGFDVSFANLALLLGTVIVVVCMAASAGIRWALPETDLRLELKVILHVLKIITACLLVVRFDAETIKLDNQIVDYKPFALSFLLFLALSILGYITYQSNIKKRKWTF